MEEEIWKNNFFVEDVCLIIVMMIILAIVTSINVKQDTMTLARQYTQIKGDLYGGIRFKERY